MGLGENAADFFCVGHQKTAGAEKGHKILVHGGRVLLAVQRIQKQAKTLHLQIFLGDGAALQRPPHGLVELFKQRMARLVAGEVIFGAQQRESPLAVAGKIQQCVVCVEQQIRILAHRATSLFANGQGAVYAPPLRLL